MTIPKIDAQGEEVRLAGAPDKTQFESDHRSWAERSCFGELGAVLSVGAHERINLLIHSAHLFGAKIALSVGKRKKGRSGVLVDFGCGTGRFVRFFASKGYSVTGIDITDAMLVEARKLGIPPGSELQLTDGVSIPARDESVDLIWVCGVLKYSLFPPGSACRGGFGVGANEAFVPAYRRIAQEMHRVLKPGGFVVNVEAYVDSRPDLFTRDFQDVGFVTEHARVLRRAEGWIEKLCEWRPWHRLPTKLIVIAGTAIAALRFSFDDPTRAAPGFRDYLFVWSKPRY
jgi:SAM-dependent methyltransferase